MYYFSYGSNMLLARLARKDRCPSAKPVGVASVKGNKLVFQKKSVDGSGKATLVKSDDAESIIYGMVFKIDEGELAALDFAEGEVAVGKSGYRRENKFEVLLIEGEEIIESITYIASSCSIYEDLKPYYWYLELVKAGARQNNLPKEYINKLEAIKSTTDIPFGNEKVERALRGQKEALEVLAKIGFTVEKENLLVR